MLTSWKQLEKFLLQPSIVLLFFFVMEDKHVPIGTKLILVILPSSSWSIEEGIHVCLNMLELLEKLLPKWKPVVDDWVVSILAVNLSSLISVTTITAVLSSVSSMPSISSVSSISSISSVSSSALHVELILIASLLAGSILRIVAPIPVSILVVVRLPLLLVVPGNPIIDTIGVLTIDGGDIISADLIIAPVEPAYEVIPGIIEGIGIAVDLQVDVAELQIKVVVVSIDGESDVRVAYVDNVMVARDVEVTLFAFI